MQKTILATIIAFLAGTGLATAQQAPAMYEGQLDRIDTNDNGGVSQEEYRRFMTQGFAKLDSNGDGVLVESETTEILTPRQFGSVDANGDGRASQDEFMKRVMKDFAKADRDRDGRLK